MDRYTTNIYKLEIDITHLCTLKCCNCDRGLSVAPEGEENNMTVEQLEKFINQTIENKHPWERIRIMGGEPTIHKDFEQIVTMFHTYKENYNPSLELVISTNGFTKKTKEKIQWVETNYPNIVIENSDKKDNFQRSFNMIHVAPCDIHDNEEEYVYKGCFATEACAIGLNYSGFYCCAVGGGIARVFNYDIALKDVKDLSIENFSKMFQLLCSKCGRYHEIRVDDSNIVTMTSKTWKKALASNEFGSDLSRY